MQEMAPPKPSFANSIDIQEQLSPGSQAQVDAIELAAKERHYPAVKSQLCREANFVSTFTYYKFYF